jgi:sugar lactone lactonase YvrE
MDRAGNLFVADHYNHTIRKLAPYGTNWIVTTIAGLAGARGSTDATNSDARFWSPTGIAVGTNNHLFVTDTANFTVREIAPQGTNWVVGTIAGVALNFGFADGTNGDAQFNTPAGIVAASDGRLYVVDSGNNAVRQLQMSGIDWVVTTIAGGTGAMGTNDGPGSAATFNFPNSAALDHWGNLYVTDQSNDTIRKIAAAGNDWTVSTIAGTPLQTGAADGLGGASLFKHPWGIALDALDRIFVADYGNQTLRRGEFVPALGLNMAFGKIVLTWPTAATTYVPETSPSPFSNATWTPMTNTPVTNGLNVLITDNPGAGAAFYRLRNTKP